MENINIINNFNLTELLTKYNDNPYILSRLATFLNNLPNALECENKKHEERVQRMTELRIEQDNFFKVFLSKHQYYYSFLPRLWKVLSIFLVKTLILSYIYTYISLNMSKLPI